MKPTGWVVLLYVLVSGCNRVIDAQLAPVNPDETIPPSAIQTVTSRFPQASDLVFTSLEKSQVWRVNFQQRASRYQAVANQQLLLVAFQQVPAAVPDSLRATLTNTTIDGGTLSNFRVQEHTWYRDVEPLNNGQVMLADYSWRGSLYTVRWTVANLNERMTYRTELMPLTQLDYHTVTLADLPPSIQQSLADQQVAFTIARVLVNEQLQKQYMLTVQQPNANYTLTYDTAGQLLAAVNANTTQRFTSVSQLPQSIQTYLSSTPELSGFALNGSLSGLAKTQYRGLETYAVNLQKGQEVWQLIFNSQGQLLSRSYVHTI